MEKELGKRAKDARSCSGVSSEFHHHQPWLPFNAKGHRAVLTTAITLYRVLIWPRPMRHLRLARPALALPTSPTERPQLLPAFLLRPRPPQDSISPVVMSQILCWRSAKSAIPSTRRLRLPYLTIGRDRRNSTGPKRRTKSESISSRSSVPRSWSAHRGSARIFTTCVMMGSFGPDATLPSFINRFRLRPWPKSSFRRARSLGTSTFEGVCSWNTTDAQRWW